MKTPTPDLSKYAEWSYEWMLSVLKSRKLVITKKEALTEAYAELGPRSSAYAYKKRAGEIYRARHIKVYRDIIRQFVKVGSAKALLHASQWKTTLDETEKNTDPILYEYAVSIRKALQRKNGQEFDCRTYAGQPGRNMQLA